MKFKAVHRGKLKWSMDYVYEPKTRKIAEQIMLLHRNMGDDILILEEDPPEDDDTQTSADS